MCSYQGRLQVSLSECSVPLKRGTCGAREYAKALDNVLVAPPSRVGRPSQVSKDTLFGFQHIAEQKNHLCKRLRRIARAKRSRRLWLSRFPTILATSSFWWVCLGCPTYSQHLQVFARSTALHCSGWSPPLEATVFFVSPWRSHWEWLAKQKIAVTFELFLSFFGFYIPERFQSVQ